MTTIKVPGPEAEIEIRERAETGDPFVASLLLDGQSVVTLEDPEWESLKKRLSSWMDHASQRLYMLKDALSGTQLYTQLGAPTEHGTHEILAETSGISIRDVDE